MISKAEDKPRAFLKMALGSVFAIAIATSGQAHTNSVAFSVTDSTETNCVGGAPSSGGNCFEVEVFYGTWHSNTSTPEGSLAIFELNDEERAAFAEDPVSNSNAGTQVVGTSADSGSTVPFAMSPEFSSNVDYHDTNKLPDGFVAGENYFYAGDVDGTKKIFGADGADYTNAVIEGGVTYTADGSGVYEHQSATAVGLGVGSYRFYYDSTSSFTATWEPDSAINQAYFSLGEDGGLDVPAADPVVPPIDTDADSYSVDQLNDGEVLPEFKGGTLTTTGNGQVTSDFNVTEENGTISVGGGDDVDFAGVFQGAGGMTKSGKGTLQLSGSNTFLGGITVAEGTLAVAADENLGDETGAMTLDGGVLQTMSGFVSNRSLSLGAGSGEVDVDTEEVIWTGDITGPGQMIKSGAGTLTLTGKAPKAIDGSFFVDSGTLIANSNFGTPDLSVSSGARLMGTGEIDGDITMAGELSVGESPGTMTVSGDVTLTPTATFTTEIDGTEYSPAGGSGSYDRTVLTGDGVFTADGTIAPVLRGITGDASNTFTPSLGDSFRVVTTDNDTGIAGAFADLAQPTDGLASGTSFAVIYGDDFIDLAVTPESYGAFAATTGNQNAISFGMAIDALPPTYSGESDANVLLSGLHLLDGNDIGRAMIQASGEIHAFAFADGEQRVRGMGTSFADGAFNSKPGQSFWADATGSRFTASETEIASSYTADTGQIVVGKDLYDKGSERLGFAIGHSESRVSTRVGASSDQSTSAMALYFIGQYDQLDVQVVSGLAHSTFDIERSVDLASGTERNEASGNANAFFTSLELGYRDDVTRSISGRAWGRLDAMQLSSAAYTETGSSVTGLDVTDQDRATFRLAVGYDLAGELPESVDGSWDLGVGLMETHNTGSAMRTVGLHGTDWEVVAPKTSGMVATVNAGIQIEADDRTTMGFNVYGAAGDTWDSVGAQLQISTSW